jgi:hypothetical protein
MAQPKLSAEREQYRQLARQKAQQYGLDPNVFAAQIMQESGFNPKADSGQARGIAQFIPSTAKNYGVDVNDVSSSLDGAARMMRDKLKQYGSYELALAAYNGGDGGANWLKKNPQFIGKPDYSAPANQWRHQTADYVTKIMANARGGAAPTSGATPQMPDRSTPVIASPEGMMVASTPKEADLFGRIQETGAPPAVQMQYAQAADAIAKAQATVDNKGDLFGGFFSAPSPIDAELSTLIDSV